MSEARPEPVRVPAAVLEGIEAVRLSGVTNMLDRPRVAEIAEAMGYDEAAAWVRENRGIYSRGIFRGFEAEPAAAPTENRSSRPQPRALGLFDARAYDQGYRLGHEVLAVTHPADSPVLDDETAQDKFPDATPEEIPHIQRGYHDSIQEAKTKEGDER